MRYGDLEGQNKVYDAEGILIPLENECVMSTIDGYTKKVEKHSKLKWQVVFFDGGGVFVFTDKRWVFLRAPIKYERPYKFSGGRFATLADWEYWTNRSNKALEAGVDSIVTCCPFCKSNPLDGADSVEGGLKTVDLMELVLEAI